MTLIVVIFLCHTIYVELIEYVDIRQAYLKSPQYQIQAFANAILVTNISRKFLNTFSLTRLYEVFFDDVRTIWINRDLSKLFNKIVERKRVVSLLKVAKTKLIKSAMRSSDGKLSYTFTKIEKSDLNYVHDEGEEPR